MMECDQTIPNFLDDFAPSDNKITFEDDTEDEGDAAKPTEGASNDDDPWGTNADDPWGTGNGGNTETANSGDTTADW